MERIERSILVIRAQRVMLDADLADLCGVPWKWGLAPISAPGNRCLSPFPAKWLNEQVKRNAERFPEEFMFRLTAKEKAEVVANCDHLSRLGFAAAMPYAFARHGAIMAVKVPATRNQWVPAVNSHGGFGRWAFIEVADPWDARAILLAVASPATKHAKGRNHNGGAQNGAQSGW